MEQWFKEAKDIYCLICDNDDTIETLVWGWAFLKDRNETCKFWPMPIVSSTNTWYIYSDIPKLWSHCTASQVVGNTCKIVLVDVLLVGSYL